MSAPRGQFASKMGFVLAAAGSAVGLGNIWGFPTQTASNGGAAFVLAYLVLAFLLAYPALMAELILGRYARANQVTAFSGISQRPVLKRLGAGVGWYGVIVASLILSFYAIIAGWMVAYLSEPLMQLIGWEAAAQWLTNSSFSRDMVFTAVFYLLTMAIIAKGVESGIERWSSRLMPMLLLLMLALIIYVLSQDGAMEGLKVYLLPDFSSLTQPKLIVSALGQAFFSLSLGVGTMLIYGSYLSKKESLPTLGAMVTLIDLGIAFTAGLLIIPAMFVAQHYGASIFAENGDLMAGPGLIFQILPVLFDSMGTMGIVVASAFFALMVIASVTSSISMLEVPVSVAVERTGQDRRKLTFLIGTVIFFISAIIVYFFNPLFQFVVDLTTKYSQPLLAMMICIFAGWILHRDKLLEEVKQGHPELESTLFWKVWPNYVRFICPLLILITFFQNLLV